MKMLCGYRQFPTASEQDVRGIYRKTMSEITALQSLPWPDELVKLLPTVIDPSEVENQMAKIRVEVARRGRFIVDCGWLRLLCPDELTENQRFARIAAIAQQEGWSFAFLLDGSVPFGAYPPMPTAAGKRN